MRKKVILLITIIIIIIATIFINKINSNNNTITLIEAYDIGIKSAKKWNQEAKLYTLTSVDDENTTKDEGKEGKRRRWNLMFGAKNVNQSLIITIDSGKVVTYEELNGKLISDFLISDNDQIIDSTDAITIIRKQYELRPGIEWAKGYHYTISKSYENIIMQVFGLDSDNYLSKITLDAITGEVLSALRKKPNGGGLIINNNEIDIGENKPYSLNGILKSPSQLTENSIIIWGVRKELTPYSEYFLKISINDGLSWKNLNFKELINGVWFSDEYEKNKDIYIVTQNRILRMNIETLISYEIYNIQSEIISTAVKGDKIALLLNDSLKYKENTIEWVNIKIPELTTGVKIINEDIFIISDGIIYKRIMNEWVSFNVPITNEIQNIDFINNYLLVYSHNEIGILNLQNDDWKIITLESNIVNVFTNNYFNLSNLIIISENGKIYKFGGDENVLNEIDICKEGIVSEILLDDSNDLYITLQTNVVWENLKNR